VVKKSKNTPSAKKNRQEKKPITAPANNAAMSWMKTIGRNWLMSLGTFRHFLWRHKTLYSMMWALILGAPPFLIVNYFSLDAVSASIKENWPVVAAILDADPIKWLLLAVLWAWVCNRLRRFLSSKLNNAPSGWENAAPVLLRLLGSVVGGKEQRFQKALISAGNTGFADPSAVFSEITQPELQMREIMQNVYLAFDALVRQPGHPHTKLKVNLAVINKDGQVLKIMYHYPNDCPVRSPMSELNKPQSAIKTAVRTKRIQIVESMLDAAENPNGNFIVTDQAREDEDGSLICYPVPFKPISDVAFVISVCYLERGTFKNRFANSYTEILEPFALRLRLEYSLLGLKEMMRNDRTG